MILLMGYQIIAAYCYDHQATTIVTVSQENQFYVLFYVRIIVLGVSVR